MNRYKIVDMFCYFHIVITQYQITNEFLVMTSITDNNTHVLSLCFMNKKTAIQRNISIQLIIVYIIC